MFSSGGPTPGGSGSGSGGDGVDAAAGAEDPDEGDENEEETPPQRQQESNENSEEQESPEERERRLEKERLHTQRKAEAVTLVPENQERAQQTIERARETHRVISDFHKQMSEKNDEANKRGVLPPALKRLWSEQFSRLGTTKRYLEGVMQSSEEFVEWYECGGTPITLVSSLNQHLSNPNDDRGEDPALVEERDDLIMEAIDDLNAYRTKKGREEVRSPRLWNKLTDEQRLRHKEEFNGMTAHVVNHLLDGWDGEVQQLHNGLPEQRRVMNEAMAALQESIDKPSVETDEEASDRKGRLEIKFYSMLQVWEGMKLFAEGYQKSFKQYNDIRAAELALKMGIMSKLDPIWGRNVLQHLEQIADQKVDAEKKDYFEYLTASEYTFKDLFIKGGGLYNSVKSNPNLALAVLEYAASHGWLYDLMPSDEDSEEEQKMPHTVFRGTPNSIDIYEALPRHWSPDKMNNYITKLMSQNKDGSDQERETYKKRWVEVDSIPIHIREMKKEMHELNFWGAQGIIEASFARVLVGYTSAWHLTTIMRVFREDPLVRQYVSRKVLDQIGSKAMYNTFFTMGVLKSDRKDNILPFIKGLNGKNPEHIADAGLIGRTMDTIEQDLIAIDSTLAHKPEELDLLVAQVLSAQDVKHGGKIFSIMDKKYKTYREEGNAGWSMGEGFAQEDTDWYDNNSEHDYASPEAIGQILNHSNGNLTDKHRGVAWLTKIIRHDLTFYEQAKAGHTESIEFRDEYRAEISRKLAPWFKRAISDGRPEALAGYNTKIAGGDNVTPRDTPILAALVSLGYIDMGIVMKAAEGKLKGQKFAIDLLEQMEEMPAIIRAAAQSNRRPGRLRRDEEEGGAAANANAGALGA